MNILFIGKVKFSEEILKHILKKNILISGIITDKKKGINSDHSDLSIIAKNYMIPSHISTDINSIKTKNWIKDKKPDVILCIGWSHLFKKNILSIPKFGVIGYHPTELPQNRGRHPIIWSLVLGLKNTASTFFLMNEDADAGKIISQKKIKINNNDNSKISYNNLIDIAKKQIITIIKNFNKKKLNFLNKKNVRSNIWRKRNVLDGKIDWRMSAQSIHNLVRALSNPYPGAFFSIKNKNFNVWKTELINLKDNLNIEPGKILSVSKKNHITVKCGEGSITLKVIEPKIALKKGDYL